jgi:hypothetical protein
MAGRAGQDRQRGLIVAVVLALLLLAVAVAIYLRRPSDTLEARAQQACLTNRDRNGGAKANTEAGLKESGVSAGAGVSASESERYEQDRRLKDDQIIDATERNRACIERFIAAERRRG